jgi:uncharacterized Fe-S cluster protein YjdI
MRERNIIKKYTKGDLTIVWEPKKCIHAAICVKSLPKVYNPEINPWIKAENASIEELKAQIDTCPSAALSYEMNNLDNNKTENMETKIEVMENGPLLVRGKLEVKNSKGDIELKDKITAFCRCGASANKPYCDGAHKKIEFEG